MINRRSQLVLRSLLLVLLFAVQALCHAHAIDHHFDGDTTACVVCSAGGTLNDAVVGEAGQPSGPLPEIVSFHRSGAPKPAGFTAHPSARAPPSPI
jgi:hypothetical protein